MIGDNNQRQIFSDSELFKTANTQEYDVWFRSSCMEPEQIIPINTHPTTYHTTCTGYRVVRVKARDEKEAVWIAKTKVYEQRVKDLELVIRDRDDYLVKLRVELKRLEYYETTVKNSFIGWFLRKDNKNDKT